MLQEELQVAQEKLRKQQPLCLSFMRANDNGICLKTSSLDHDWTLIDSRSRLIAPLISIGCIDAVLMKLFLIRHGETVDNIAGNLAGVTDSELTNYGVDQIKRLGTYLATEGVVFTHIFASPLSRAYRTAEAIQHAQRAAAKTASSPRTIPDIVKVSDLIEQDFGSYEAKPFGSRSSPAKSGRAVDVKAPGFVDVETRASMAIRADAFLDKHLMPVICTTEDAVIAVASHGMLLSSLWKRILLRLSRKSLTIAPEVTAARGAIILEHPGGWSNTGYLELHLVKVPRDDVVTPAAISGKADPGPIGVTEQAKALHDASNSVDVAQDITHSADLQRGASDTSTAVGIAEHAGSPGLQKVAGIQSADEHDQEDSNSPPRQSVTRRDFTGFSAHIARIDSRTHLVGLKRQRGGIGSLAHDKGQSKMTNFFKKPRID